MHTQVAQTVSIERQLIMPRANVRVRRRKRHLKRLIAPLLLFVTLLAQISIRVRLIEEGYEFERLRVEALAKDSALRQAKMELAMVTRPGDVTEKATKRLGFVGADPVQVRALLEDN